MDEDLLKPASQIIYIWRATYHTIQHHKLNSRGIKMEIESWIMKITDLMKNRKTLTSANLAEAPDSL